MGSAWYPTCGSWKKDTLNLTNFGLNGETIMIRFTAINDYGNRFFMDNVKVNGTNISFTPSVSSENKKLIKIVDVLGRVVDKSRNTLLFYIYDDGSIEEKIFQDISTHLVCFAFEELYDKFVYKYNLLHCLSHYSVALLTCPLRCNDTV